MTTDGCRHFVTPNHHQACHLIKQFITSVQGKSTLQVQGLPQADSCPDLNETGREVQLQEDEVSPGT